MGGVPRPTAIIVEQARSLRELVDVLARQAAILHLWHCAVVRDYSRSAAVRDVAYVCLCAVIRDCAAFPNTLAGIRVFCLR